MKKIKIIPLFLFLGSSVFAQKTTTLDAAIVAAIQNNPSPKAAALEVQSKVLLEKTARNLSSPELNVESPTGEFYTFGVSQSFEWPTVYARQKRLAKAETLLAQTQQRVDENDLRFLVRSQYLAVQVADFRQKQLAKRDSLYQKITVAAERQFVAGEIDFLQKIMAENELGKVRQAFFSTEKTLILAQKQLAVLTGLTDLGTLSPLNADLNRVVPPLYLDSSSLLLAARLIENPNIINQKQAALVAEQQVFVAKNGLLPSFSLGYLNQGARSTPLDYRFRASVGIPLWVGQNRAGVDAAEAEADAAHARADAQGQSVVLELQRVQTEIAQALQYIEYFEREALPRSRSLITAATRLRDGGQIDYVSFLKSLEEAFSIERDYAEQLESFQLAYFQQMFLLGQ